MIKTRLFIILFFCFSMSAESVAQEKNATFSLAFKSVSDQQLVSIDLPDSLSKFAYNRDYSSNYSQFNDWSNVPCVPAQYIGYQFVHKPIILDREVLYPPRLRDPFSHFGFSFESLEKMDTIQLEENLVSIPLYTLPSSEKVYDSHDIWDLEHEYLLLINIEKRSYNLLKYDTFDMVKMSN